MLNTEKFVQGLIDAGVTHLISVPCSHAKDLINAFINHEDLTYLPAASESVALSLAAGQTMAGGKPIVVVQSSGLANMASGLTSLIQPYGIKFPIITSWRSYEPGDSEIQHAVLADNLPDFIGACGIDYEELSSLEDEEAISQVLTAYNEQFILVIKDGQFSKVALKEEHVDNRESFTPRGEFLEALNEEFADSEKTFVGTTGATSREMATLMPDTKNFYMAGNMGNALSVGLGAAIHGKDVVVLGGDAESVMHMGGLATAAKLLEEGEIGSGRLSYVIMNNMSNFTTGGQPTPIGTNLVEMLEGFLPVHHVFTTADLIEALQEEQQEASVQIIVVECGFSQVYPRPTAEQIINSTKAFQ